MQSPKPNLTVYRADIHLINNLLLKKAETRIIAFAAFLTLLFLSGAPVIVQAQTADNLNANIVGVVVQVTVVQPDGKILIGGEFNSVLGVARNNIARLNVDGTLDLDFNPNASGTVSNGAVLSIAVQADGKVLAGGYFTNIGGQTRNRIARLDAVTGAVDATFNLNATSPAIDATAVLSIKAQSDGKILVGGVFTNIGGQTRNNIARFNSDGTLDTTFNPNANSDVFSIAVQADGKVLIGGGFNTVGGQARNFIARLNTDGTLDTAFNPDANDSVFSIAVQADGKILVGGNFTNIGGQARNFIARLNTNGTLEPAFNPDADDAVLSIVVQLNGKILVGGFFTNIGGQARNFIARLTSTNGAADNFHPNAGSLVYTIALQANNKVLVGGFFTNIGDQPLNLFARLNNEQAPIAATATVSGRVMVRGRGLARAYVTIGDSNGMIQRTMTNPQGFYRFENIQTGSTYTFDVVSKRYTFATQVVTISENISDLNFTAR